MATRVGLITNKAKAATKAGPKAKAAKSEPKAKAAAKKADEVQPDPE